MSTLVRSQVMQCRWLRKSNHLVAAALVTGWLWGNVASAGILIVAPHPDDDIIAAAGVARKALGVEEVTVVFMTNGDASSIAAGLARQGEAVQAQVAHVGTAENNLIFLGYPDGYLPRIRSTYTSPGSQFVSPLGQSTTYGTRGLGHADYHTFRFGSPAAYNLPNVLLDLRTIMATYRPENVFTTSEFDAHADHQATYHLVKQAIADARSIDPAYAPILHSTVIWSQSDEQWPGQSDPRLAHVEIQGLGSTSLQWINRESLDVPLAMQDPNLLVNPKFRAIESHVSQARNEGLAFIEKFARRDEVFWAESTKPGNAPPVAEAGQEVMTAAGATAILDGSASRDPDGSPLTFRWTQRTGTPVTLDNSASANPRFLVPTGLTAETTWSFDLAVSDGALTSAVDTVVVRALAGATNIAGLAAVTASSEAAGAGQFATRATDGIVGGFPEMDWPEWSSYREKAGAWIMLSWPAAVRVESVRLFDRPNSIDQITGGTLTFSDGSSVAVGSLDNDGRSGASVSFSPRVVTSVRFTVTSTSSPTKSAGLAEFQVLGSAQVTPDTAPPTTPVGLQVSSTTSTSVSLVWQPSTDTGGSGLVGYRIYRDGGVLPIASGSSTSFTNSGLTASTAYTYRVAAYDGAGNESAVSAFIVGTTQAQPDLDAPSTPAGVTVSGATVSSLTISWLPSSDTGGAGLAGYRIFRNGGTSPVATVTATSFTDSGLSASTSYTYRVAAFDVTGNQSPLSNASVGTTVTPPDTTAPTIPAGVQLGAVTSSSVTLVWQPSIDVGGTGVAGYRVYRGAGTSAYAVVTGTSFTDTGLSASTPLSYRVSAFDVAGNESGLTATVTVTTSAPPDVTPPSTPAGLNISSVTENSLALSWQPVTDVGGSGLAGYRIYRNGATAPIVTLTATTYSNTGLTPSTDYSYQVTAVDVAGNESPLSALVTARTLVATTPINFALTASVAASSENSNSGQLAIKAVDGVAQGYPVDRTREWATLGQRAGAWIRLTWPSARTVDRIVLYDRPNTGDHIRGGTLTFSDGTTVAVGALDNTGLPTTITFGARSVTSVTFTVTVVRAGTENAGLAEFEVWGR